MSFLLDFLASRLIPKIWKDNRCREALLVVREEMHSGFLDEVEDKSSAPEDLFMVVRWMNSRW